MEFLIVFAIIYGIAEGKAAQYGWTSGNKWILSHFSFYHVVMFIVFATFNYLVAGWQGLIFLPMSFLVQDIFFFVANNDKMLDENSWVNWGLSGFYLKVRIWLYGLNFHIYYKQWIPNMYIVLIVLYLILILCT